MAIGRVVVPEILDGLPSGDPAARRSRRDLRWINGLMGNFRWAERQIQEAVPEASVVEIGAGEGVLSARLAKRFPGKKVTAVDLAPAPGGLAGVEWRQGDLFQILPGIAADVVLGVMIVHHFSDAQLAVLGHGFSRFQTICLCEPWRTVVPRVWGGLMRPLVGEVTRHDLPVSVRAGFRPGELAALLGLEKWKIKETVDWRGSIRLVACKN